MRLSRWDMVLIALVEVIAYMVFARPNDVSLVTVHALGNVPYGILWALLNPYYWTDLPFKLYVLGIQLAMLAPVWWLVKRDRLNPLMVCMWLATTAYSMWFTGFGVVSMTLFQPLAVLSPLWALPGLLQAVPIWSLNPVDPHLQCFLGNCGAYSISRTNLADFATILGLLETPSTWGHLTSLFWMALPIVAWLKRRNAKRSGKPWDEMRFWILAALLLVGLFLATYVTYAMFGCCASWTFHGGAA